MNAGVLMIPSEDSILKRRIQSKPKWAALYILLHTLASQSSDRTAVIKGKDISSKYLGFIERTEAYCMMNSLVDLGYFMKLPKDAKKNFVYYSVDGFVFAPFIKAAQDALGEEQTKRVKNKIRQETKK